MLKTFLIVIMFIPMLVLASEKGKDYTIISDEREAKLAFEQCSRMTPTFRTGYRQMDEETVKKIEAVLPQALKKASKGGSVNLDDYQRQYVAFEMLRREMVYVNAFHKEDVKSWAQDDPGRQELLNAWQSKAISVCGGEQAYWGALYDDLNGVITEVLFNTKAKSK